MAIQAALTTAKPKPQQKSEASAKKALSPVDNKAAEKIVSPQTGGGSEPDWEDF